MTRLECPTCERPMRRPSHWIERSIVFVSTLLSGTFIGLWVLYPPQFLFGSCVSAAQEGQGSLSSCYGPAEPWLALGWLLLVIFWGISAQQIHSRILEWRRELARWYRVRPQLIEAAT